MKILILIIFIRASLCLHLDNFLKIAQVDNSATFFTIRELNMDSNQDPYSFNCTDQILVWTQLTRPEKNGSFSTMTYFLNLHTNGDLLKDPATISNCQRTKLYDMNVTHSLLRFGQFTSVTAKEESGQKANQLLRTFDVSHYLLSLIKVYDELTGYNYLLLIVYAFISPTVYHILLFIWEILFFLMHIKDLVTNKIKKMKKKTVKNLHKINEKWRNENEKSNDSDNSEICDVDDNCRNVNQAILARYMKQKEDPEEYMKSIIAEKKEKEACPKCKCLFSDVAKHKSRCRAK